MDLTGTKNFLTIKERSSVPTWQEEFAKSKPVRQKTISLCMIVKNEEAYLANCLESAKDVVDEIIIVDTGSTDKTLEIAAGFGAKIYHFDWVNDFSIARNAAIQHVTSDWVLQLDADEVLTPESQKELRRVIQRDDLTGLMVKIVNHINLLDGNRETIEHYTIRVFPRHPEIIYREPIHEQVKMRMEGPDGKTFFLPMDRVISPIVIEHFGYNKKVVKERDKCSRNLQILENSLEQDRKNAFQHFNLGITLAEEERFPEALEQFRIALKMEKTTVNYYPTILVYAAQLSAKLGQYDEAVEHARLAIELSPKLPDAFFQMGEVLRMQGDEEESIRYYKEAIDIGASLPESEYEYNVVSNPGNSTWKPYNQIGAIYSNRQEWDKAAQYLEKAVYFKPDTPILLVNLGITYRKTGKVDLAEDVFKRAYKIRWDSVYGDLFDLYFTQAKWTAIDDLLDDLKNKLSKAAWLKLGCQASIYQGAWPKARVFLEELDKLEPNNSPVCHDLGVVYCNLGMLQDAENVLRQGLELDANNHDCRIKLGFVLFSTGKYDEARQLLEQIPWDLPQVLNARLLLAHILSVTGKINEGLGVLLELNDKFPDKPELLLQMGYALFKLKAYIQAYEILSLVVPHQPDNTELYIKLALTAGKLGDFDSAKTAIEHAMELDPSSGTVQAAKEVLKLMSNINNSTETLVST